MTDADQFLLKIRKACTIIGRDAVGRVIMQLVLKEADVARLLAFGEDVFEGDGGDQPYRVPPASVCWLDRP
jgi:hypothetical protein